MIINNLRREYDWTESGEGGAADSTIAWNRFGGLDFSATLVGVAGSAGIALLQLFVTELRVRALLTVAAAQVQHL
jgi:hypothetical protein